MSECLQASQLQALTLWPAMQDSVGSLWMGFIKFPSIRIVKQKRNLQLLIYISGHEEKKESRTQQVNTTLLPAGSE